MDESACDCVRRRDLFRAIQWGHTDCVRSLTKMDPSIANRTWCNRTPLHECTYGDYGEQYRKGPLGARDKCLAILLKVPDIDVDAPRFPGVHVLEDAILRIKLRAVSMLLKRSSFESILTLYCRFAKITGERVHAPTHVRKTGAGCTLCTPALREEINRRLRWGGADSEMKKRHNDPMTAHGPAAMRRREAQPVTREAIVRVIVLASRRGCGEASLHGPIITNPHGGKHASMRH